MILPIPDPSLLLLIGPSGSGKSTFARRHFAPSEVLSSDFFRGMVCDDESDQTASADAFTMLHLATEKRLSRGRFTVIDATNVQFPSRLPLLKLVRRFHLYAAAIVFNMPVELCQERNEARPDRGLTPKIPQLHAEQLERSLGRLADEGFQTIHILNSPEEVNSVEIRREPLAVDLTREHGPFDIVGDVHGCADELKLLLGEMGYSLTDTIDVDGRPTVDVTPPEGRRAIFLGDLVDRGPNSPGVLRLVMRMVDAGHAFCVPGNHDAKLWKKLVGRSVVVGSALASTLKQLDSEPPEFLERVRDFLDSLESHFVLDEGKLVVAHAGMKQGLQGRVSKRVRDFALYGETTGETDDTGMPVRMDWARDYKGRAKVVYGHTAVESPEWYHNTICIDTGCAFGGRLTALRYPELELVSVPAARQYAEPRRPLLRRDIDEEADLSASAGPDSLD